MVDTPRTKSAIMTLLADNTSQAISAQDLRDSFETMFQRTAPSVREYGAAGDGVSDDLAEIQAGIDDIYASGGGTLYLPPGNYGVTAPIVMKPGVRLLGCISPGYSEGWDYVGDTTFTSASNCRITALNTIVDPVIKHLDTDDNNHATAIEGLVVDGAMLAENCVKVSGTNQKERRFFMRNCHLTGATSHGLNMSSTLTSLVTDNVISACAGYAINLAFGVSDCVFSRNYIKTCNNGILAGAGCFYVQINGGKIEELYGVGVKIYDVSNNGTSVRISDVTFQNNHDIHINVEGGTSTFCQVVGCTLNSPATQQTGTEITHFKNTGGVLTACNNIMVNNTLGYIFKSLTSAKTFSANNYYIDQPIAVDSTDTSSTFIEAPFTRAEPITGFIEVPAAKTYNIVLSAKEPFTVNSLVTKMNSGTATVAATINGTNITGLSGISATTTKTTTNATAANRLVTGDTLALVVSAVSSPVMLAYQINRTRS